MIEQEIQENTGSPDYTRVKKKELSAVYVG